jgi:predicted nucleic acid-binding protein
VKIYLDVCCLCRPFDNHHETRIRLETEAILAILKRCSLDWELVTSTAVMYEVGLIGDPVRKSHVIRLTHRARETIRVNEVLLSRAEKIGETGIMGMDAIHIACAERAGAVFLTTDDEVIRIMKKHCPDISIRADNPLRWLMELNHDGE